MGHVDEDVGAEARGVDEPLARHGRCAPEGALVQARPEDQRARGFLVDLVAVGAVLQAFTD